MANRIRELRDERGWSQEVLGERAKTSGQQIGRLEKGTRRLDQKWMKRLSEALGVAPADLLPHSDGATVGRGEGGKFVEDPEKLAWLKVYDRLTPLARGIIMAQIRDAMAAEIDAADDVGHSAPKRVKKN